MRTIYDLSDEEYDRYERGDEEFYDVTQATIDDSYEMMGVDPYED